MSSEAINSNEMRNDPVNDVLHLSRMHDTDKYKVAEDDPDVRGWEVISSDGTRIGRVDDLIVDTQAKKVRYLDVEIDSSLNSRTDGNYLLIPIGLVNLHEEQDQIVVHGINSTTLSHHAAHSSGTFSRDYEESIHRSMGASSAGIANISTGGSDINTDPKGVGNIGSSFYNHSSFDEDRFHSAFRTRRGQKGFMPGLSGNVSAFNSGT